LCEAVIHTARSHAPMLLNEAQNISSKYENAFTLFAECHRLYDSSKQLSESEIEDLGEFNYMSA